ncbi:MAG: toll/interleukin-1 receptor domain-containing protein [Bauldia sp.]|nr:toll/interleukin-1 receptor domain-containing protein [Bauldia sp.]
MARIFLSHSSANNAVALAVRDWLVSEGWDDLFLDVDPSRGIVGGERWERALNEAANRCEAVLFLVSRAWLGSQWCLREFHLAQKLNKQMFGILVEPVPMADIPAEVKNTWQLVDLASGADHAMFRVVLPDGAEEHVTLSKSGLARLKAGLAKAGLDARFFPWPPEDDPDRPPYRGMRPLEAEDAGIFFGREASTIAALDRLRGLADAAPPRFVVVLGASGAGKSSYLRAGLLPRLQRDDRHFLPLPIVRPERAALSGDTGLLRSLEAAAKAQGLRRSRADIKSAIAAGAPAVAALLGDLAEAARPPALGEDTPPAPPRIVLSIDQGEELFLTEGGEEADAFLRLVHDLVTDPTSNLIVLVTIRSDAYERLQIAPALEGVRQETLSLPPMPRGAYQTVIEGPAARLRDTARALRIEPALTAALLTDIEEGGAKDALPLLAFTLERLYLEYGGDGDLRLDEYEDLGRIRGSINAAVEGALKAADGDPAVPRDRTAREALLRRALIPWLAGIDPETGSPRRRVARLSEIPEEARPLIAHLIDARLLATDRNAETGETTVEPAHEALLRQWGLLQGWLEQDFAVLSNLEAVRRAARDWEANARDDAWLTHAGGRLEDAEALLSRDDLARSLDAADRAYLAAARAIDTARRNRELEEARKLAEAERVAAERQRQVAARTRVGLVAASLFAIAAAGAAFYGFDQANRADEQAALASEQAEIASANQKEAEVSAARLAVTVASAAIDRGATGEAADLLLKAADSFDDSTAPDAMQIAFHRLNEAMEDKTEYPLPDGAVPVEGPDALYFIDAAAGDILRFDGDTAPAVVYDGPADQPPIRTIRVLDDDKGTVIVREDGTVLRSTGPEASPVVVGSVQLAPAGALDAYDLGREVEITRDGLAVIARYDGDIGLQILDTATGHAYAGADDTYGGIFVTLPDGSRYLAQGLGLTQIVDTGSALALQPVAASEDDVRRLKLYGCFVNTGSAMPAEMPEFELDDSFLADECRATEDGVLHTFYSSGSAGVGRYDEVIRPGEEPLNLADVITDISKYDLRHNFAWIGFDPAIRAYTVLVNRDLLVFNEYQMFEIRKHPVEVGPARLLGDGRIAIAEPAANRVIVRDISGGELRDALSRADEEAVVARNQTVVPLNKGSCVGYAIGGMSATLVYDHAMPDGATISIAGSTGTSSDGPPRVTIVKGDDRQELTLGDIEACVQFSADWKRAAVVDFDGNARMVDFDRFRGGASFDEATIDVIPGRISSAFPVGDGSAVLVSSNEGAVLLLEKDAKGGWQSTELYRGDYPVFYAEPDATAKRLLVIESTGGGDARGFLYSVPAAERWLELGSDYKWFGEAFADDGGIASGARGIQRFVDLPPLSALVAETAGRVEPGGT